MKKVLIVIHDMESGGAQKSLASFLRCMCMNGADKNYEIDLIVAKPTGIFMKQIPEAIHLIETPKELLWLGTPSKHKILKEHFSVKGFMGKAMYSLKRKMHRFDAKLNEEQKLWASWKNIVPEYPKKYDVAISYMNGFPNYYVMEKVKAQKKVLWIHNEYQKIGYEPSYDRKYYEDCDEIITISEKCVNSFLEVYPGMEKKIHILENITLRDDILERGKAEKAPEFSRSGYKFLSVGRLSEQKGFDLAIEAAECLKRQSLEFFWMILGEGPEREKLQALIDEKGLQDCFLLAGIRENPYPYINDCDIFVQTSLYEGKSIVLDEAKIYGKPIVVTDYPTVYDSIVDGKTGLIIKREAEAVAEAITKYINNPALCERFATNLLNENNGNESELNKYIDIML